MAVADGLSLRLFNLFTIKNAPSKLCMTSKSVPGLIPAPASSPYLLRLPEAVSREVVTSKVFRSVERAICLLLPELSDDCRVDRAQRCFETPPVEANPACES